MKTIKCKECGKELSKKAKICPNCGCGVNQGKRFLIIFSIILIVCVSILAIAFLPGIIRRNAEQVLKEKYSGTWVLQTTNDQYYNNNGEDLKLLLDEKLVFNDNDVINGSTEFHICFPDKIGEKVTERCTESIARVYTDIETPDIVDINFIDEEGNVRLIRFKYNDDNLKQINCANVGKEKMGIDCINENLDITYVKE